jgi:hypothetical protein
MQQNASLFSARRDRLRREAIPTSQILASKTVCRPKSRRLGLDGYA